MGMQKWLQRALVGLCVLFWIIGCGVPPRKSRPIGPSMYRLLPQPLSVPQEWQVWRRSMSS